MSAPLPAVAMQRLLLPQQAATPPAPAARSLPRKMRRLPALPGCSYRPWPAQQAVLQMAVATV